MFEVAVTSSGSTTICRRRPRGRAHPVGATPILPGRAERSAPSGQTTMICRSRSRVGDGVGGAGRCRTVPHGDQHIAVIDEIATCREVGRRPEAAPCTAPSASCPLPSSIPPGNRARYPNFSTRSLPSSTPTVSPTSASPITPRSRPTPTSSSSSPASATAASVSRSAAICDWPPHAVCAIACPSCTRRDYERCMWVSKASWDANARSTEKATPVKLSPTFSAPTASSWPQDSSHWIRCTHPRSSGSRYSASQNTTSSTASPPVQDHAHPTTHNLRATSTKTRNRQRTQSRWIHLLLPLRRPTT